MFSQRNNPYCELLQNCITNIEKHFKKNLRITVICLKFLSLYLKMLKF